MPSNTNLSYPPYIKASSSSPIKNNGGVFMYAGTPANTANTGINYLGYRSGICENLPPQNAGSNIGVVKGLTAGTWQKMEAGQYIMLTYTNKLAGTTNTMLNSPSAYGQKGGQNLASSTVRTTSYILGGGWYYMTGQPVNRYDILDTIGPEAYPGTRAIPGRLFYMITGALPTVTNYKAIVS